MKKLLSVVLAVVMMLALLPNVALAEQDSDQLQLMKEVVSVTTVPEGYVGIYTAADMKAINTSEEQNYILMADIDMGGAYNPWKPMPFRNYGVFDGNGHTISNLYIKGDSETYSRQICYGLFSSLSGTVKNLKISNLTIIAEDKEIDRSIVIGGIACQTSISQGIIENCTVSGNIKVDVSITDDFNSLCVGGFVGLFSGEPSSCMFSTSNVAIDIQHTGTPEAVYVGGFVGEDHSVFSYKETTLSNLCNNGTISVICEDASTYTDGVFVGGVIGQTYLTSLEYCYNTAEITARAEKTRAYNGGIVGYANGKGKTDIEKSYNLGKVTGASKVDTAVGGILGAKHPQGTVQITDCYNRGSLMLTSTYEGAPGYAPRTNGVGGIIGEVSEYSSSNSASIVTSYNYGDITSEKLSTDSVVSSGGVIGYAHNALVKYCYWKRDIADAVGYSNSTCSVIDSQRLRNLNSKLQATYAGFDFSIVWIMDSEEYGLPILRVLDKEINDDDVFIKQATTRTCTLASAVMMLRRRAILDGRQDWKSITEQAVRKIAWGSNGLAHHFSYTGMYVDITSLGDYPKTTSGTNSKKSLLINLLASHPEGISVGTWRGTFGSQTHAILLTDYDSATDTFYCADPALGNGRILLTKSTIKGGTQEKILTNLDQYWLITRNNNQKQLVSSTIQSQCPVDMLISINDTVLDSRTISGESDSNSYASMEVSAVKDGKNITANINGDYAKTGDVQVNLFGTDTGEMTFTVTHHFSDGTEETSTFRNVPLTETTTGYAAAIYPQSTVLLTMTDTTNPENPTYWAAGPSETVTEPTTDFDAFPDDDSSSGSNNSSTNTPDGGDEEDPDDSEEETPEEEFIPLEGYLETEDHLVYISGDDDLVHPDGKLTRAEAAAMIYSLLRTKPETVSLHFADVAQGAWYQPQVDTLAELGVVVGMGEGLDGPLYAPNANITRAEFSVILSRFFSMETGETKFKDLDPKAWYYPYMSNAVLKGWVSGYEDGTARPNANITRAEAITLLNKMLGRSADAAKIDAYGTDGKIFRFLDLPLTHWAYYHIMEASTPHTYETDATGAETWKEFSVPTAAREPGYRLYSGSLYKIDNTGHYVRNHTDGVLRFGSDGKYTTGNATLDTYLRNAVQANTVESDTLENNWKRLYKYAGGKNFSYLNRAYLTDGQTGWEIDRAIQMFQTRKGNCYNYAAITTFLARSMGYQATALSGFAYMPQNGYYVCHGWTQIAIEGVNYVADPELQYVFARNRNLDWDLFMKPYKSLTVPKYRWKGVVLQ